LSAFYASNYAASGLLFPILPLLLATRGFTATEIALVMTASPIMNLIAPPIWAAIADAFHARLMLLKLVSFCCAVTVLLLVPDWSVAAVVFAMGFFCFFRAPIYALADAAVHAELGPARHPIFARIRGLGSLGFAIGAGIGGILERTERGPWVVVAASAAYLVSLPPCFVIEGAPLRREPAILGRARAFIQSAHLMPLFAANAVYYTGHAMFDSYFSLFLGARDLRGIVGPAWMLAVMFEVMIMLIAPRLLQRLDPLKLVLWSSAVAIGRWLAISVVRDPLGLVLLQALHGLTFGLWWIALVRYVQDRAPDEVRTSVQGALLASLGLGSIGGNLLGGVVLDHFGGEVMFRVAAMFAAAAFLLYARVCTKGLPATVS
jgi:MFS family permease